MIARLRGELLEAQSGRVVVDAGGVGYEVLVPESVLVQMPSIGEGVELHVRQVFREDGVTLYGFVDPFERRVFDLVTDVKGCGPKTGLAIIGELGAEGAANAIAVQDAKALSRASGVGPRLAERIILELREKIQQETFLRKVASSDDRAAVRIPKRTDELIEALLALGYRRQEAEQAADVARDEADTVEEQVLVALRSLRK